MSLAAGLSSPNITRLEVPNSPAVPAELSSPRFMLARSNSCTASSERSPVSTRRHSPPLQFEKQLPHLYSIQTSASPSSEDDDCSSTSSSCSAGALSIPQKPDSTFVKSLTVQQLSDFFSEHQLGIDRWLSIEVVDILSRKGIDGRSLLTITSHSDLTNLGITHFKERKLLLKFLEQLK